MPSDLDALLKMGERYWQKEAADGRVWFIGEINVYRSTKCYYALSQLAAKRKAPIHFIINTIGGDVDLALGLYDLIVGIRKAGLRVDTVGIGFVCSAGLILLQAGERRYLTPHTLLLMHELLSWYMGRVSEHEDTLKGLKKNEDLVLDVFSERSGKTKEQLRRLFARKELWMTPDDALKHNLADEIITTLPFLPHGQP